MKLTFKKGIVFALFLGLFLSPYIWVLPKANFALIDRGLVTSHYILSFAQAFFSTVITLVLGVIGAKGLFWLESRIRPARYALYEFLALLPALLPALFLVVPLLNLMPFFPFGFPGVVLLHGMSEASLAAIAVKRIFSFRLAAYSDAAHVMGSSGSFFIRKTFPLLVTDFLNLALILFVYFLTSFSIPLLIGGSGFSSLEVSLYERIVVHHDWAQAINLFIFQFLCIGSLLMIMGLLKTKSSENNEKKSLVVLENPWGLLPVFIPPLLIFFGLLSKLHRGFELLVYQPYILENGDRYLVGSLLLGFMTAGAVFFILTIISYFLQVKHYRKFFFTFFTPSFVILGFAFYLLPGQHPNWIFIKISWALTIAFVPVLLRLGLLQKITALDDQMEMSHYLGAGSLYTFSKITWPQCLPLISLMSGLAGVWAVGDFSLSRVVAGKDVNLAMWVQSLVDQYRWDIALVLSWMILACAFIVFGFFWGVSYVARKKLS
jgi:thiamine transport system permease protein